jgi:hypothetical protein
MMRMFGTFGLFSVALVEDLRLLTFLSIGCGNVKNYVGLKNELLHCPFLRTRQIEFF